MVARQEEMRRKTAEHEAALRTKTELAKAKAEADGRIRQERENHDLILQKLRLEAGERRDTILKGIADAGKLIGQGLSSYLDDTKQLTNTAVTVTGIAIGVYTARTSIGIAGRFIESRLGKPSLVRETSRFTASQLVTSPISSTSRIISGIFGFHRGNETDALKGIVLHQNLDKQLRQIAISTANTKRNRAPFRHLLLHGTSLKPELSLALSFFCFGIKRRKEKKKKKRRTSTTLLLWFFLNILSNRPFCLLLKKKDLTNFISHHLIFSIFKIK